MTKIEIPFSLLAHQSSLIARFPCFLAAILLHVHISIMDPTDDTVETMDIEFENGQARDENNSSEARQQHGRRSSSETELVLKNTATELEAILNDVKVTTKRLLEEITNYTDVFESVLSDYERVQASQRKEAQRLDEVSPDVEGATNRFLEQHLAMVGGMTQQDGVTGRVDLAAMLSGEHYGETK
jgi:hypothetical protein